MQETNIDIKLEIDNSLNKHHVAILPPMEAKDSMKLISQLGYRPTVTMLDPWYNRGVGGVRDDYVEYILDIISCISDNTNHLYLWGFPEIVAQFINKIPSPLEYVCWLTWYFKNCPSVVKGWRSSQQTCLHYAINKAKMYPEHFFNPQQQLRFEDKKMRFIPGPSSVIEESLLVGFVGKNEQTGHPSQKPEKVYEKLLLMATQKGDLAYDPMCGAGTTAIVAKNLKVNCIISDSSDEFLQFAEKRLKIKRLNFDLINAPLEQVS